MRRTRSSLAGLAVAALLVSGSPPPASGTTLQTVTGTVRLLMVDAPRTASERVSGNPPSLATHATEAVDHELTTRAVADVGGRLVDLPEAQSASLKAGDTVRVTTARHSDVAASVVRTAGPDRTAVTVTRPTVIGDHTLTVLPVYWTSPDPNTPLSALSELAAQTADYWSQQSGGRIAVVPTVRDWARIADPGSCSSSALANAALAAHQVPLPSTMTDHVLFYFPHREDCGWAGLGQVSGPLIWDNGYPLIDVLAHEFGHNLGLGHANTAVCVSGGSRVTLSSSCSVAEYRDYADVMGIAMDAPSGNLNTALADSLGLVHTVRATAGTRTSVELAPLASVDAVRAVKIRVPNGWVYIDYRPAVAPDVRMPAWGGVQAHLLPDDDDIPTSRLLDGHPATAFADVAIPVGTTWAVPDTGLGVTVTSVTPASAHVEVAPVGGTPPPPTPVVRSLATGKVVGASTALWWWVPSAVASLRLSVDGRVVSTPAVSALSGTLRVTGLVSGRHTVTLQAADIAGRLSAPSAPLTLVSDVTPPSIPSRLTFGSDQVLRWRASSDATAGVAGYLVSLDGGTPVRITRTATTVRTPVGRHTWWVAAVDRAGNVSPASGLVVVRTKGTSKARTTSVRKVSSPVTSVQRTLVTGRTVGASRPL